MVVAFLCPTSFLVCCLFLSTDLLWTVKIHIVHSVICLLTEQGRLPQHEQGTQAAWSSRVVLCKLFVQVVNYWWMIMLLLFSEQERKWFSICHCGLTFLRQKLNVMDLIFVNGLFKTYVSWMLLMRVECVCGQLCGESLDVDDSIWIVECVHKFTMYMHGRNGMCNLLIVRAWCVSLSGLVWRQCKYIHVWKQL